MDKKKIPLEKLENYLAHGDWLHVFFEEGHKEGEQWSRKRVIDHVEKHGAEVAGEAAARHQHGIFSGGVFIQTRSKE